MNKIILKTNKEIPVKSFHHWIFSGGIAEFPSNYENGDIVKVYSSYNEILGHAFINKGTVIAARMINFSSDDPLESIKSNIESAVKLRSTLFNYDETNCYRVINSESDRLPGITVDRYNEILVIQISTTGMDRIKDFIVNCLVEAFKESQIKIKTIYEKSTMSSRKVENLPEVEKIIWGEDLTQTVVLENNIQFYVDIVNSQKTGLFLDMREMRKFVGEISKGKSVLNCFCYTGGFSLYAAANGAKKVDSLDIAKDAVETAKNNFELNNLDTHSNEFFAEDAFKFLKERPLNYDLVILDPPAFAKKKSDIENAKKGYYQLNKLALTKIPSGSLLLTCSCSYHVHYDEFEKAVMKAGKDTKRTLRILQKHHLAPDHPINLYHTEIDYLKSILLYVE